MGATYHIVVYLDVDRIRLVDSFPLAHPPFILLRLDELAVVRARRQEFFQIFEVVFFVGVDGEDYFIEKSSVHLQVSLYNPRTVSSTAIENERLLEGH